MIVTEMLVRHEAARKRPKSTRAPVVRGGGGKGRIVRADADEEEEEEATSTSAEETETETETEDDDDEDDRDADGIGVSKATMMGCESYDAYLRAKPETWRRRLREAETERVGRPSRASVGNDDEDDGEGSRRKTWYHTGPRERIVAPSRKRNTTPTTRKSKAAFDEALASAALVRAAGAFGSGAGRSPKDQFGQDQSCVMCDAQSTPQWRIFPQRFVSTHTCAAGLVVCNKCYAKAKRAYARRVRDTAS